MYLRMFRCGNTALLTIRFFGVAKFTALTPLSLIISCKLSFQIGGLKIFFLPTFALKSPNKIFIDYFENQNLYLS